MSNSTNYSAFSLQSSKEGFWHQMSFDAHAKPKQALTIPKNKRSAGLPVIYRNKKIKC